MSRRTSAITVQRRQEASEIIAAGGTVGEAAKAIGVHKVTLYEWLKQPDFILVVEGRRRIMMGSATGHIFGNVREAAIALVDLLKDGNPWVRFRAATAMIDFADQQTKRQDMMMPDKDGDLSPAQLTFIVDKVFERNQPLLNGGPGALEIIEANKPEAPQPPLEEETDPDEL